MTESIEDVGTTDTPTGEERPVGTPDGSQEVSNTDTPDATETPASEPEDDTGETTRAGRESAKYRTRLRAAEADLAAVREELQAQELLLATARRSIVEELSGLSGRARELLWELDTPGQLWDDAGRVDRVAVAQLAQRVRTEFGLARGPLPDPGQGRGGNLGGGVSFTSLVRGQ